MLNIKSMNVDEMLLALDRISRFKFPETKLKRVYTEIISVHYLEKNLKKADIESFDNSTLTILFTKIWNYSIIKNFGSLSDDFSLNKNYIEQEKKCYILTSEILELMPKKVDFRTLCERINPNLIPNNFTEYRTPKKIVLTEGATEEILLPEFLKRCESVREEGAVKIVATGGKNQILRQYKMYKEQIKVPIFILLDCDAVTIFKQLQKGLRKIDKAHLIKTGEIEDIIPAQLFKKAINSEYKQQSKISLTDFNKDFSMVKNLHNIFKENGFGEFKKAKVAQLIKNILPVKMDFSGELAEILGEIKNSGVLKKKNNSHK